MSLKNVDIESAIRRLADRRIEEAMKQGKFDNLRGVGQPIELEDAPADENAKLMWWALRILRNNDVIPDEIQWRKSIENLKAELENARDEKRLKNLVVQINTLVYKLNTLGTNAIKSAVAGVDLQDELNRLAARQTK
ncbi:MAG TPA: DUF1992 domain-containing protein [Tepidisphaeraceae bacterium]|nr:DUF1992 domain-containing protein [Tepidisphaeraceae bacterium]